MTLQAMWSFIAGDSRFAPLGVALAVIVALTLTRLLPSAGAAVGAVYVAIIAGGLIVGVFERT